MPDRELETPDTNAGKPMAERGDAIGRAYRCGYHDAVEKLSGEVVAGEPETREMLTAVQKLAGRAMTRLNKVRVGENVRQQQLLAEAREQIAELLDRVQAAEDRFDDREESES